MASSARQDPTRRAFLELAAALGVAIPGAFGCARPGAGSAAPRPGDGAGVADTGDAAAQAEVRLRAPDTVGTLRGDEIDDLFAVFQHIGRVWDNRCHIDTRDALAPVLALKTGRRPSYLTEYRAAVEHVRALRRERGLPEALDAFYLESRDAHLRRFVIAEFLRLQVAFGGFRAFGAVNYKGHPGGPFAGVERLPYRAHPLTPGAADEG